MSMQGIGPTGLPQWVRSPETGRPAESEGAGAPRAKPAAPGRPASAPVAPPTPETPANAAASVPDGVDGELWSLLTTEERAHFARFAAMGGVTYGPKATTASSRPPVQGQRLDLRI